MGERMAFKTHLIIRFLCIDKMLQINHYKEEEDLFLV